MNNVELMVRQNLSSIIEELSGQSEIGGTYDSAELSYKDEMKALREYVDVAHEYAIAYEVIVATLEKHKFVLSARSAVRLLEVGLIMRYKTERKEDSRFDTR